jgi:hypothetical protein
MWDESATEVPRFWNNTEYRSQFDKSNMNNLNQKDIDGRVEVKGVGFDHYLSNFVACDKADLPSLPEGAHYVRVAPCFLESMPMCAIIKITKHTDPCAVQTDDQKTPLVQGWGTIVSPFTLSEMRTALKRADQDNHDALIKCRKFKHQCNYITSGVDSVRLRYRLLNMMFSFIEQADTIMRKAVASLRFDIAKEMRSACGRSRLREAKSSSSRDKQGPCGHSCAKNDKPWAQKCDWKSCNGCSQCLPVTKISSETACADNAPPNDDTCQKLKDKGGCNNKKWKDIFEDGYCQKTCGHCTGTCQSKKCGALGYASMPPDPYNKLEENKPPANYNSRRRFRFDRRRFRSPICSGL